MHLNYKKKKTESPVKFQIFSDCDKKFDTIKDEALQLVRIPPAF